MPQDLNVAELREAASIEGCSPFRTMLEIILPLSKSILIVITLYYFDAMMYLRKHETMPPAGAFAPAPDHEPEGRHGRNLRRGRRQSPAVL